MTHRLVIVKSAQRELADLPKEDFARIVEGIRVLAVNPRPVGCLKLSGREGWRLRVGVYRVLYEIDDAALVVTVLHVGHRRDVYR